MRDGKSGLTLGRIVLLTLLMALATQVVLMCIGYRYAGSVSRAMSEQTESLQAEQFQRNTLNELSDMNSLMLLLQTSDYSNLFRNLMKLRPEEYVAREKELLNEKLDSLRISPELFQSIYFIGSNQNQLSYRKTVGGEFKEMPDLNIDALSYAKIYDFFISNYNQISRYGKGEYLSKYRETSGLLSEENRASIEAMIDDLDDQPVMVRGNKNILVLFVLNKDLFRRVMPDGIGDARFSVVNAKDQLLWSTSDEASFRSAVVQAQGTDKEGADGNRHTVLPLPTFDLRIVYTSEKTDDFLKQSDLLRRLVLVSGLTLAAVSIFTYAYLKQIFRPFRTVSSRLKNKLVNANNEMVLLPIPEAIVRNRFRRISMRTQFMIMFSAALMLPAVVNGLLFSRTINSEVSSWISQSADKLGKWSVTSIGNQIRYAKNVTNQIGSSRQFQNYLIDNQVNRAVSEDQVDLKLFPGLNDISYFVLLDDSGKSMYSSIFSNNIDNFKTDFRLLENRDDAYWLTQYRDVFNHLSVAVVKRLDIQFQNRAAYLLVVPKDTLFRLVETDQIRVAFVITDSNGERVNAYRTMTEASKSGLTYRYSDRLAGTSWKIELEFMFNDALVKSQAFQQQYALSIMLVFVIAAGAAIAMAYVLTRPIQRLRETMHAAEGDGIPRQLDKEQRGELAGIVTSYNRMIAQLELTTAQNRRITEENAQNKIRQNELMSLKTQAELHMLQAQINPHFLYNTLEMINMQSMRNGNREVSSTVNALADLLRYSIAKGADTAPLDRELNHAANYLKIQQARFGSFDYSFEIEAEARPYPVLRFILQPILENSIKHGFEGWEEGGRIVIRAERLEAGLELTVSDNGIGMSEKDRARLETEWASGLSEWSLEDRGIGLKNVYLRLKLYYKEGMSMAIESGPMQGTTVRIRLPWTEGEEA